MEASTHSAKDRHETHIPSVHKPADSAPKKASKPQAEAPPAVSQPPAVMPPRRRRPAEVRFVYAAVAELHVFTTISELLSYNSSR